MTKNTQMKIRNLEAEIIQLRRALMKKDRHFMIIVEALSEIKATSDGLSEQPIADIISGCVSEIQALGD